MTELDVFEAFEQFGKIDDVEKISADNFVITFASTVSQSAASPELPGTVIVERSARVSKLAIAKIEVTLVDSMVSFTTNFHNLARNISQFL